MVDLVRQWEESRKHKDPLIESWFKYLREKYGGWS